MNSYIIKGTGNHMLTVKIFFLIPDGSKHSRKEKSYMEVEGVVHTKIEHLLSNEETSSFLLEIFCINHI